METRKLFRRKLAKLLSLMIVFCLLFTFQLANYINANTINPVEQWHLRNYDENGPNLEEIIYGENKFVSVGEDGVILTSLDGVDWHAQNSGVENDLKSITFGNGLFITVGTGIILTSEDGSNWTKRNLNNRTYYLEDITYGDGKFIAVGYYMYFGVKKNVILISEDGLYWKTIPVSKELLGVTYGNDLYVAIGKMNTDDYGAMLISVDGEDWYSEDSNFSADLYEITYNDGKFIAIGTAGYIYSENGLNWNTKTLNQTILHDIGFGNSIYVAIGEDGLIYTSNDLSSWSVNSTDVISNLNSIVFCDNTFVVVGDEETILQSGPNITGDFNQLFVYPNYDGGLYNKSLKLTLVSSEGASIFYSRSNESSNIYYKYVTPIELNTEETTIIKFYAVDEEGNQSPTYQETYIIDYTSPAVTAFPTGETYYHQLSVSLLATESATIYYTLDGSTPTTASQKYNNPINLTNWGNTKIKYFAVDLAGNRSKIYTDTYNLVDPDSFIRVSPIGGIYKENFYLSFSTGRGSIYYTLNGNTPTLNSMKYQNPIYIDNEGLTNLKYIYVDSNGNRSSIYTEQYLLDTAPPITTISLSGTQGKNDWFITNVRVNLIANDNNGSGIKYISYSIDGVNWYKYSKQITIETEGTGTIYFRSVDNAGNTEAVKKLTFKIDKTGPAINIISPVKERNYALDEIVKASWSASDKISGIASTNATYSNGEKLNTKTTGEKTFVVEAWDKAGNKTVTKVTYYVDYQKTNDDNYSIKFLPPLDNDGDNIFKQGRTIPIKFKLNDSYIDNTDIKLYMAKVTNGFVGKEVPAIASGKKGNLFRYDSKDKQHIFNLSTKSMEKGTWQLRIKINDDRSYYLTIVLK